MKEGMDLRFQAVSFLIISLSSHPRWTSLIRIKMINLMGVTTTRLAFLTMVVVSHVYFDTDGRNTAVREHSNAPELVLLSTYIKLSLFQVIFKPNGHLFWF